MTKLLGSLTLAAMTFAVAPQAVLAEEKVSVDASFAVAFSATPNTGNVAYCGGTPLASTIEAHGDVSPLLELWAFRSRRPAAEGCFTGVSR